MGVFVSVEEKTTCHPYCVWCYFFLLYCPSSSSFPKPPQRSAFQDLSPVITGNSKEGATESQEIFLEGRYLLADAGITCQGVGILLDGKLRGCCATDLQHCTPLAKVSTIFLVLGTALSQFVKSCR